MQLRRSHVDYNVVSNIPLSKHHFAHPKDRPPSKEEKTSSLFSAASILGGIVAKQSQETLTKLKLFGRYLGISFQILDDVLDYDISSVGFGKKPGDDFKEGKVTLPLIIVFQKGNDEERSFLSEIMSIFSQLHRIK